MDGVSRLAGLAIGKGFPVRIVAVLNASPESFFQGSIRVEPAALGDAAVRMVSEGADVIDVGAQSTAPYKQGWIDEATEISRMVSAVRAVTRAVAVPVSVDTQRAAVARAALAEGARIVNDVSGLSFDREMASVAASADGVILVASETGPSAGDSLSEVEHCVGAALERARAAGVTDANIVVDPGLGFFRHCSRPWFEVDLAILGNLSRFAKFGMPLLVGASRKSFLGEVTGRTEPGDRLAGSLAAATAAVLGGAAAIRTHDVAATRDAVRVAEAIRRISPRSHDGGQHENSN